MSHEMPLKQWNLHTKAKVFDESNSCLMKCPWNCTSWNALKEKFHSVSLSLEILSYIYFTFLTVTSCERGTDFYRFLLGKGFHEKCKHTHTKSNLVLKNHFPFIIAI